MDKRKHMGKVIEGVIFSVALDLSEMVSIMGLCTENGER